MAGVFSETQLLNQIKTTVTMWALEECDANNEEGAEAFKKRYPRSNGQLFLAQNHAAGGVLTHMANYRAATAITKHIAIKRAKPSIKP